MKPFILIIVFFINLSLFGFDIKMRVVDDEARPVTEAHAGISFVMYRQGTDVENDGMTDKNGFFGANGAAKHSVYIEANKPGHYEARVDRLPKDKDLDLTVVIPRIIQPIPLYARQADAVIPTQNEWLGYDFEIGDWVAPIGLGKVTDIRFKFRNEFKGWRLSDKNMVHSRQVNSTSTEEEIRNFYGKWDGELEISFPAAKEGLFEELRFLKYSQLKLPHQAPLEGYGPTWRYTDNSYSPPTTREQVGFFLRTRVKLDAQGNIISAHYTKIMGDIRLAAQGSLHFTYYFNPTANDRNLEFDPTKNLFPINHPGAHIIDP